MYKAERNTYKFTVYNYPNLTISTFRSMYKAEKKTSTLLFLKLILNVIAKYLLFEKRFKLTSMKFGKLRLTENGRDEHFPKSLLYRGCNFLGG